MRHPLSSTAVAALLLAVPLAGCSSSSSKGAGTTARSTAPRSTAGSSPAASSTTGTTSPVPSPPIARTTLDPLTGRRTALTFDTSFVSALTALSIKPGVVGRASLDGATLDVPITGGRLVVTGSTAAGKIQHTGSGLSLTAGGVTIDLVDLIIDENAHVITATVKVDGTTAMRYAGILDVYADTGRVTGSSHDAAITGQTVRISTTGAALVDKAFRTTAIRAGVLVGTLAVTATA